VDDHGIVTSTQNWSNAGPEGSSAFGKQVDGGLATGSDIKESIIISNCYLPSKKRRGDRRERWS
jgi:hypothetical protein